MRMTSDGRNSAQLSSHGLHSSVPSPEVDRDVTGQVVVVALAPEGAGQNRELLRGLQIGEQLVGGGESIGYSSSRGRTTSGRGWR